MRIAWYLLTLIRYHVEKIAVICYLFFKDDAYILVRSGFKGSKFRVLQFLIADFGFRIESLWIPFSSCWTKSGIQIANTM